MGRLLFFSFLLTACFKQDPVLVPSFSLKKNANSGTLNTQNNENNTSNQTPGNASATLGTPGTASSTVGTVNSGILPAAPNNQAIPTNTNKNINPSTPNTPASTTTRPANSNPNTAETSPLGKYLLSSYFFDNNNPNNSKNIVCYARQDTWDQNMICYKAGPFNARSDMPLKAYKKSKKGQDIKTMDCKVLINQGEVAPWESLLIKESNIFSWKTPGIIGSTVDIYPLNNFSAYLDMDPSDRGIKLIILGPALWSRSVSGGGLSSVKTGMGVDSYCQEDKTNRTLFVP